MVSLFGERFQIKYMNHFHQSSDSRYSVSLMTPASAKISPSQITLSNRSQYGTQKSVEHSSIAINVVLYFSEEVRMIFFLVLAILRVNVGADLILVPLMTSPNWESPADLSKTHHEEY
jgi:hypothetical protein